MPYVHRGVGEFKKFRIMLSGISNTGKTWSLRTFEEKEKSLVVIVCPGEAGVRSLPEDSEYFQSYCFEAADDADMSKPEWCRQALDEFSALYREVVKNKPDKLFIDGIHHLYTHTFNVVSNGEFLAGTDLDVDENGRKVNYRGANLYGRGHRTFGNWLNLFMTCSVPFVGVTVWEELQDEKDESDKPSGMRSTRYYHPALPGRMAINVSGRFDVRLSARVHTRCVYDCPKSKQSIEHHVWQFLPSGDVQGVGVKGLKVTEAMAKRPWIHQSYSALKDLMERV